MSEPTTTSSNAPNRHVHTESLSFGFFTADQRADEQTRRQPSRGDPEQAHLNVPCSSHAVGQPVGKRESIEPVAFHAVMRRHDSEQHLHEDQGRDDPEVFDRGFLRWRGLPERQWIGLRGCRFLFFTSLRGIPPRHRRDARQQHDDAHAGPDNRVAGRPVANQRFMRPVVGVGADVIGSVGRSCPRRPEEESRQLAEPIRVGHRSRRNGVVGVSFREDFGVVGEIGLECLDSNGINRDRAGRRDHKCSCAAGWSGEQ